METTQESIHGHEVIQMMMAADCARSRAEWVGEIGAKFGAGARFHTCSAESLTAEGLIDFLQERGKLHGDATGLAIDPTKVCQH